MKLAVVVQRYGPAIHGGAERHARYIAEHLAQHADVEVLTTTGGDTSAPNEPDTPASINGVTVRRFRASPAASASALTRLSERVVSQTHALADELTWLEAYAPVSAPLIRHLRRRGDSYDFCVFVGVRCCQTYYGAHAVPSRAVLIPRAESDPSLGARIFRDVFCGARAILYDSPEERELVQSVAGNDDVPNVVAGAGVDIPHNPQAARFRQKHNVRGPFALSIGETGTPASDDLIECFNQYSASPRSRLSLVLVGDAPQSPPAHPKIKHVGTLDDADKFDALAAAEALIVPSRYRSFSRTALEAWTLGKPVLANDASSGMRGLCARSNGGLSYRTADEFAAMLQALEQNRWLNASLGKHGRQFVRDNYDWHVVERKYHDLLLQLQKSPPRSTMAPIPGWMSRRRRDVPPAADRVRSLA